MTPRALVVRLAFDEADLPTGSRFWGAVTGWRDAEDAGEQRGQFRVTPHSRGMAGVHLGLVVDEVDQAVAQALGVGAGAYAGPGGVPGATVVLSPAGFHLHLEPGDQTLEEAPVVTWPSGHQSRTDQLTIDVEHACWDRELAYWQDLTGWPLTQGDDVAFARLQTPAHLPVRVLLQRRDAGPTTAHLDIATSDRDAEVARLVALGATRLHKGPRWTALRTPVGPPLCVTDRAPSTGLLPDHRAHRAT
jgi:hypothetical protein